jgi:hypothetical protein
MGHHSYEQGNPNTLEREDLADLHAFNRIPPFAAKLKKARMNGRL